MHLCGLVIAWSDTLLIECKILSVLLLVSKPSHGVKTPGDVVTLPPELLTDKLQQTVMNTRKQVD